MSDVQFWFFLLGSIYFGLNIVGAVLDFLTGFFDAISFKD